MRLASRAIHLGLELTGRNLGSLAGTETTSTSMTYSLWLLSTRPHVLATLQAELDAHAELDEVLSLQLCARLPYLNAVIKESAFAISRAAAEDEC